MDAPTYVLITNLNMFGRTDKGKSKCPRFSGGHKKTVDNLVLLKSKGV